MTDNRKLHDYEYKSFIANAGRRQTIIGSDILEDHEIHKMSKILHRIIGQMSPEEQDKLNDAEVFIGYWHD